MSYISSFLVSICASCIFLGAMQILCPTGQMNKSVKFILGLVFLVMIISSAGIIPKNIELNIPLQSQGVAINPEMDIKSAEYVFATALSLNNIEFSKITVCTDKTQNDSIVINKVIIETKQNAQAVLNALGDAAKNFNVEVVNE